MKTSEFAIVSSKIIGKVQTIIGYILGIFFLIMLISGLFGGSLALSERFGFSIFCLVMMAVSALLIVLGAITKRRLKRFKVYINLITVSNLTSLDDIAKSMSQSIDFVRADIQKMIDKKYFVNTYIDKTNNEVVVKANKQSDAVPVISGNAANDNLNMETVVCTSCGANNAKRKGSMSNCEYCGTPLK